MYRQRKQEGDAERALEAYQLAVLGNEPVADAYLNLGYLLWKKHRFSAAKDNFRIYLQLQPDADDRAMIEYYLEES